MNISFDLLKILPYEVNELIFDHLSVDDLLNLSTVSPAYHSFIGSSKRLMRKITLNIPTREETHPKEAYKLLKNSPRNYQNVKIAQRTLSILTLSKVLEPQLQNLATIFIYKTDFYHLDDFLNLMSTIEESIQEIHLELVYIMSFMPKSRDYNLKFTKLTSLNAKCIQALIFHEAFGNCKSLKKLDIKSGSHISKQAHEAILKLLKKNDGLQVLGIHYNAFNLIFLEDIKVGFKLKEFRANDLYRTFGIQKIIEGNFLNFLKSQMDSLEVLTLSNWLGLDVMKMIFQLPKLKHLNIKGFHNSEEGIDWRNHSLHKINVETIILEDSYDIEMLYKIIAAVNWDVVKHFKIHGAQLVLK